MKRVELSKEEIDKIIILYTTEPIGTREIGKQFSISREVITRILKENGIKLTKCGQKFKGGKQATDKRYREKHNKDGYLDIKSREWANNNKERIKKNNKEWRDKNADKLREKKRNFQKQLIDINPQYKLSQRISTAIWQNIKDNGLTKYNTTFNLLGYTFNELKSHLENHFEEDMNWENYGEWHVDHAIPQSYFKYTSIDSDEFKSCWSLNNLKPMWGRINMSKNNKLNYLSLEMIPYINNNFSSFDKKIEFKDNIISKEYLIACIKYYGKDYVENYLDDIIEFIWKISPELPKYENNENLEKLKEYTFNLNPTDENGNIINTRINSYGNLYLKSRFNTYWKSSYNNHKSPKEMWLDKPKMRLMLRYRLGINNALNGKGEFFNISLHQCLKGISATRTSISFFKPLLASFLYKKYLGDIDNPIVFDPCCGFGGRLLGFKIVYPNGIYIGCEPNVETYNELIELSKTFKGIIIHNCKFEDLTIDFKYDLSLTSIPYFDLEKYSEIIEYNDFDDWKIKFITPLLKLKNSIINMSLTLSDKLNLTEYNDSYLINNKNHFNKKYNKEVILKMNF